MGRIVSILDGYMNSTDDVLKICSKCKTSYPLNIGNFGTDRRTKDGLTCQCKGCRRKNYIKYAENNIDRIRERAREYARQRRLRQPLTVKKQKRASEIKRMDERPELRVRKNLRRRLNSIVRKQQRPHSIIDLVQCTLEELKSHIELLFIPGMSWENYGEWHIDHIKPCSLFDLTDPEQQKMCFHYSNLQPLWAEDNVRKSNKYTSDDTN